MTSGIESRPAPRCCQRYDGGSAARATASARRPAPAVNEIVVDRPFDETWDLLVRRLSESFFVVNNISKESRLINLSFSSADAQLYVDCERTQRTFEKGRDVETFDYAVAEDGRYMTSRQLTPNAYAHYQIQRRSSVEGRIDVYMAPEEPGTRLTVNTRYIFGMRATGRYDVYGGALDIPQGSGRTEPFDYQVTFDTRQAGSTVDSEGNEIWCQCTGELEARILEWVGGSSEPGPAQLSGS